MKPKKIYVASSWRNLHQPLVVQALRELGHDVYDFRRPPGGSAFSWKEVDGGWQGWTTEQYREALRHPIARAGFASDMKALRECDACVLVMPCGRSANWELGFAMGEGKPGFVVQLEPAEPELMYSGATILASVAELRDVFELSGRTVAARSSST